MCPENPENQNLMSLEVLNCVHDQRKRCVTKKLYGHFFVSGLQTSQDARFYASSARFEPFSNEGKPLVIQFTVKHEQKIDCGGGYVKVFPTDLEQTEMHGESSYYLMFGT